VRGAVHRFRPGAQTRGHEQQGNRYAVVVLATRFVHLSQWIIVPTSTRARAAAYRPLIEIAGRSTVALCDGLVAVDPEQRLDEQIGYLPHSAMREIDWSLALLLDLRAPDT
jgi:mRNA interferase MazF